MCYVRTVNNNGTSCNSGSTGANSGPPKTEVMKIYKDGETAALLQAAVAATSDKQATNTVNYDIAVTSAKASSASLSPSDSSVSLMDQLLLDSLTFEDSWFDTLNTDTNTNTNSSPSEPSSSDYSLFGDSAAILGELAWQPPHQPSQTIQNQQINANQLKAVTTSRTASSPTEFLPPNQLHQHQHAIWSSVQTTVASPIFPSPLISSTAPQKPRVKITVPLFQSPPLSIDISASVLPNALSKKRPLAMMEPSVIQEQKEEPARKSKKSVKVVNLETKCKDLEQENSALQVKLAIMENGTKFFAQREKELVDRVHALESQLNESHRAMLNQMTLS
ncbi:hypothetical protein HK100_009502 [Physocladia obscura]|uniref:BZIP domain-containing protein n=1 Tax=Physocladia obscura TaxID=109957 RepID=A0AAD5XME1_9FUNG|nr:hypothetical protein HK100_009502 [Physocladia obscura]